MMNFVLNRINVLDNVLPCLANEVEGKKVVKSKWLDLDLYFRIPLGDGCYLTVTDDLLYQMDLSVSEIEAYARRNIRNKCVVQSLDSLIFGLDGDNQEGTGLMVMTTKDFQFGAATMLLTDRLDEVAKSCKTSSLFVIPSSIHEVLLLANTDDEEGVNDIIRMVNNDVVSEEERLSDHVYKYTVGDESVRL